MGDELVLGGWLWAGEKRVGRRVVIGSTGRSFAYYRRIFRERRLEPHGANFSFADFLDLIRPLSCSRRCRRCPRLQPLLAKECRGKQTQTHPNPTRATHSPPCSHRQPLLMRVTVARLYLPAGSRWPRRKAITSTTRRPTRRRGRRPCPRITAIVTCTAASVRRSRRCENRSVCSTRPCICRRARRCRPPTCRQTRIRPSRRRSRAPSAVFRCQ